MNVGKRVKMLRMEKGLSQKHVVEKTGMSQSHYSRFESGEGNVSLSYLLRIVEAIGVTMADVTESVDITNDRTYKAPQDLDKAFDDRVQELEQISPIDLAISCKTLTRNWDGLSDSDKKFILYILDWTSNTLKGNVAPIEGKEWIDPAL